MIRRIKTVWLRQIVLTLLVIAAVGCKSISLPPPPVADVTPDRKARVAEAAAQFESRRNRAQLEAARAAWDRGDPAVCRENLESLLKRTPSHRDARLLLADVCMEEKQPAAAIEQVEAALADYPRDPVVHNAMAVLLEKAGRADEAVAYYQRAADFVEHEVVIQAGHDSLADPPDGKQANASPEASASPDKAGRDEWTDRNEWDGLADSARLAAAENLMARAEALLVEGQTEQAMARFADAAAQRPNDPYIPTTSAVAALRAGRPDVAISLAREALQRFPRAASLYRVLGTAHYRQGEFQTAQLVLQQALSLDKSDGLAYFLMGCTLAKLGQPDAAAAHFAQARRLEPRFAARAEAGFASAIR